MELGVGLNFCFGFGGRFVGEDGGFDVFDGLI